MTEHSGHQNPNEAADALSAYWDSLGGGPGDIAAAPAGLAKTIARLHASDTTPHLSAAGRKQIWEEVMAAQVVSGSPERSPRALPSANGRAPKPAVTMPVWPLLSPRTVARPNWLLAQVATAALLLLTIGLAYFAFGPGRSAERVSVVPEVLPAGETPSLREVTADTLAAITLPAGAVPSRAGGAFGLYRVPPGTASTWEFPGAAGPRLTYVLAGSYSMKADARTLVLRGGAQMPQEIPAGETILLEAGDALLSRLDDAISATNEDRATVELLDGVLYEGVVMNNRNPIPPGWVSRDEDILWVETAMPTGPATLQLRRSTLAADDVLSLPPAGVVQLAVSPDEDATLGTEGDFAKRNVGGEPITVYALTLERAGTGSETPALGEAMLEPVFATTLPAGALPGMEKLNTLILSNVSLDANTRVPVQGENPGALLTSVRDGQLTLRVDGPLQVFRGPAADLDDIAENTETVLQPGDTALYDYTLPAEFANQGSTPVRMIQSGFLAAEHPDPLAPFAATDYAHQYPVPAFASEPVRATLLRAVVPPKGELSAWAPGARVIVVGAEEDVSIGEGSNGALRNIRPKPAAIYVLTLESAGAESALLAPATPTAGEPTTETLVDTTIEAMPVGHANVEVDRWRLRPNPTPLTQSALGGTLIFLVETGQITAGAAGIEQYLAAGDQVILTGGQTGSFVASGDAPASTLTIALAAGSLEPAKEPWLGSPAYTWDYLMYSSTDGLPGGSGRLLLEQLTLPLGTALPPFEAQPWSWTDVGSGALGLTLDGEKLPFRWKSGAERTFRFSQRLPIVQPGTRMTFRNVGDDPLVLYRLTLIPREVPAAGAAPPAATPRSP